MYYLTDQEFYHHGILGMKWGIRRYQPYPDGKKGLFVGQSRGKDIRIKAGTDAYRVSGKAKLTKSDMTYVALNKLDNLKYLGEASAKMGCIAMDASGNDNNGRPYNLTIEISNDLIAPSYKKTMDMFVRTMEQVNPNNFVKDEANKFTKEEGEKFISNIKNLTMEKCKSDAYLMFCKQMVNDNKAKTIFFDQLKANGYNAIIDEWDAKYGTSDYLKSPIIVLDPNALNVKSSYKMTKEDVEYMSKWIMTSTTKKSKKRDLIKEAKKNNPEQYKKFGYE